MISKFSVGIAAALAAMGAVGAASAATVDLSANDTQLITLHDVSKADLSFALNTASGGYSNYGGYIKWSTKADGRQDWDGPFGTCYECGYAGGAWSLAFNPWDVLNSTTGADVTLDFGSTLETVYVWVRATYGAGSVGVADDTSARGNGAAETIGATAARSDSIPVVPLPAAGVLLVSALAAVALMRRREAA
ncbi:MAG TPA: VPLPA-CTERM sorting domain-containing protein [Paenirhodobacter sp.]